MIFLVSETYAGLILCLTSTSNSLWHEISELLLPGQTLLDRHYLFKKCLNNTIIKSMDLLTNRAVLRRHSVTVAQVIYRNAVSQIRTFLLL